MRTCTHARRLSGVLALLVALIGLTPLYAQSAPSEETVRTVRRMLEVSILRGLRFPRLQRGSRHCDTRRLQLPGESQG